MTTYVTYDARSGRIISVHHGTNDVDDVRRRAEHHSKIDPQDIDLIPVRPDALQKGKRYKVDHGSKSLVEATSSDSLGFSFGMIANLRGNAP